jgi:hypothetical protein
MTHGTGIWDLGSVRKQDPDLGSRSRMNNPNHISENLETIFLVKILKFFAADRGWKKFGSGIRDGKNSDPGWKKFGSGIRDKNSGSATLLHRKATGSVCLWGGGGIAAPLTPSPTLFPN